MLVSKFKNTQKYMASFTERLKKLIQIEIGRKRTRTYSGAYGTRNITSAIDFSGKGRKTLKTSSKFPKMNTKGFTLGHRFLISGLSYLEKVDKGGKVKADIDHLTDWVRRKARLRDLETGKLIEQTPASLKYVAGKIKKKLSSQGMKPTNFIDDAINKAMEKINAIEQPIVEDVHINHEEILTRLGFIKQGEDFILKQE